MRHISLLVTRKANRYRNDGDVYNARRDRGVVTHLVSVNLKPGWVWPSSEGWTFLGATHIAMPASLSHGHTSYGHGTLCSWFRAEVTYEHDDAYEPDDPSELE